MARLRTMRGVQRVSLASSEKAEGPQAGGGGRSATDCRNGNSRFPQFQLVIFFDAPKSAQAAPGDAATAPQGSRGAGRPQPTSDGSAK